MNMGEDNGSTGGLLKEAGLTRLDKGKIALLHTKEFPLKLPGLKFAQINFPILSSGTAALLMDLPGNNRFSGTRFPGQHKRSIAAGKLIDYCLGFFRGL